MKNRPGARLRLVLTTLALSIAPGLAWAQEQPPVVVAPAEPVRRTAEELETLLGPIALYPDALIALLLPAAAAPVDIVLAARYLKEGGEPNNTGARAWDESVKSLAHYPDVVKWMDENIEWTKQVGEAFLNQPDDVMKAIQRLRERAHAAGTLVSTPQQTVAWDSGVVTIVPAQPDVIYVPRYEPDYVFINRPINYAQPIVTFGLGFAVGPWLTHDCDWPSRRIWVVNRQWSWRDRRDWRHPVFPGHPGYVANPHRQPWRPAPDIVRPPVSLGWGARPVNRPVPMAGAPAATFTTVTTTTTIVNPPPRRERDPDPRRPGNTVAPVATTATTEPSPSVPVSQWNRPVSAEPDRRGRPANATSNNRPAAPAMTAPPQAVANSPVPERRAPPKNAPPPPSAATMNSPAAPPAPAHAATQPRPQISMSSAPAPQAQPRAASAPPPTTAAAPAPARAQPNPSPPPPSRDDRDNNRKKVEQ
ncbi:MAG: DUF3300 domain-containing protein [Verrucomicrobia bacterium]|nr:DUF3300 domain-containing protein [Verrucomicrobiota bacterium]